MTRARPIQAALLASWSAAILCGIGLLLGFASTPGDAGDPPASWPDGAPVPRPDRGPILLMAAHPRCPCTRASLYELERLAARTGGRLRAYVLLILAAGEKDWGRTDIRDAAARIPGVVVLEDPGGRGARRFGLRTSGHVLLYGEDGTLLFSGGLTPARGHAGDSAGALALRALLRGAEATGAGSPVFGCPLKRPDEGGRGEGEP